MPIDFNFTEKEREIGETIGYPAAYAELCRHRDARFYGHGPPFAFTPYSLQQHEVAEAKELDQAFPIRNPEAKQTKNPKIFLSLLWKQLNHLGNAGFDPAVIRVDPFGNVLYYHADSASPLAWDVDHWFPCSRGGLTVPNNLRILQWQACMKKHNKLEFLIPWWDFQLGVSVNQFLSIFASSNSDFRRRAFHFLFSDGENEELNASQTVESHSFPKPFVETEEELGLAPAAIVTSPRDYSSVLRSLDYNSQQRPHSPLLLGARTLKSNSSSKENENPDFATNPYQAIVIARDSLKQREESAKMKAEILKLDVEVDDMRRKNEDEKLTIQQLELALTKRKRRVEKCRRVAESQSSYRSMLEKMIRDAMHQSVIYKEQVRLNQAASNSLMARLEAQKAICDAAEKELYHKHKHRKQLEKQIKWPETEQARKRSRMDDSLLEENESKQVLYLPKINKPRKSSHKELRVFLEEEQRAAETVCLSSQNEEQKDRIDVEEEEEEGRSISDILQKLEIVEEKEDMSYQLPVFRKPEMEEEDEESRKLRGKGNVEKWLQMLLEKGDEEEAYEHETKRAAEETTEKEKQNPPQMVKNREIQSETDKIRVSAAEISSHDGEEKKKERRLVRSASATALRRIPSSPSLMLGMRKGVDCLRKKLKPNRLVMTKNNNKSSPSKW